LAVIKNAIVELLESACYQRDTQKNTTTVHVKCFLLSTQQTHKCDHTNRRNRVGQNFGSTENQPLRIPEYKLVKKNLYPSHCVVLEFCLVNFVWVTLVHVVALKIEKKSKHRRQAVHVHLSGMLHVHFSDITSSTAFEKNIMWTDATCSH